MQCDVEEIPTDNIEPIFTEVHLQPMGGPANAPQLNSGSDTLCIRGNAAKCLCIFWMGIGG